jgi:AcrR family transcriptional regulator/multidrug efflux pump subunit AcrA (membrane-fusion protein)
MKPAMTICESARKPGRPKNPELEERRRGELLDAAALIFARDGFAETDVQDIADTVGVSKGTVYRYFESKDELFLATVDRGLQQLCEVCDAVFECADLSPLDMVRTVIRNYLAFFHRRPEMAELFIQERAAFRDRRKPLYFMTTNEHEHRDRQFVNALIAAGAFREVHAQRTLDVVGDLLFGTIVSNHLARRRVSPDAQSAAILDVLFHGLLSDRERKKSLGSSSRTKTVGGVVALLVLMLTGCLPQEQKPVYQMEPDPIPVTVTSIQKRDLPRIIQSVGTLHGIDEVLIAPKTEGRINAIHADIGDRIWPGEKMLEIDPTDAKQSVQEGHRALSSELARLGLSELPVGQFQIEDVPGVKAASVAVEDALRRLKQKEDLKSKGGGSVDELELAQTEVRLAEARKKQAMTEAESCLAAAKWRRAQLDGAEQRLRDCMVVAPESDHFWAWAGAVGPTFAPTRFAVAARMASEGEMIRSNPVTNVFKLVVDSTLKLKTQVAEQYSSWVKVGQTCDVRVDAFPNRIFPGRVARVNPTVDPQNRTFGVEIEVPNFSQELKSGSFAKVNLLSRVDRNIQTLPPEAIVGFAGITKIYIVREGQAHAIEIKCGARDRGWVEIIGDIPPDAQVLTSGFVQVVDGSKIIIRESEKQPSSQVLLKP